MTGSNGKKITGELLVIFAALLIPLAPHTRLFSENLPAMTLDFPFFAACGVLLLYPALKQARQSVDICRLLLCWVAFALLAVISWYFSGGSWTDLFGINLFAYYGAVLVTVLGLGRAGLNLRKIFQAFYAAAFIVALVGIGQYFFYEVFINQAYINAYLRAGLDNYGYYISDTLLSTLGNPNQAGIYLGIILMAAIGSSFWGFNHRWQKAVWVAVLITAIILSQSRTAFISIAAGYFFFMIFFQRNGLKNFLYTAGGAVAVFLVLAQLLRHGAFAKLFDISTTLQGRFTIWDAAVERFFSSPLLGAGPNPRVQVPGSDLPSVPVDNVYLTVLCSYGVLGFLVLAALVFFIFNALVKAGQSGYGARNIARGLTASLVVLLTGSLAGDFLFNMKIGGSYLLMLASFLAAAGQAGNRPSKVLLVGNARASHLQHWGKSLAGKGYSVHLLSPEHQPVPGCSVHVTGSEPVPLLSAKGISSLHRTLARVENKLNQISPGLVHIHGAFSFGWFAASYTEAPVVVSIWGSDIYRYAAASRRKQRVVKSILNRTDLVTVPTGEVARDVQKMFGNRHLLILPWGVDDSIFYPPQSAEEAEATREWLQVPPGAQIVLSPRSLSPVYNIEAILETLPRVLQAGCDVYFCFLRGSGSEVYAEQMKEKAAELGVKERTRWIAEFLPREKMASLFRASDVFVSVPDTDNLGSTILEGLACGSIPVVKQLKNYQCLYDTRAVMYPVPEVNPSRLAGAITAALQQRTPENIATNAAAGLTLGTWQQAVDKMAGTYRDLMSRQNFLRQKHIN